ncbi:MAG: serine/threonine protein kinase [Bacteriovoracaceae bacterium]|jgi:Ser/Thr protein kinase RdoA (MazF antagonist)|nr:serine/threonine protein kinase [Bacteriovoracaceae bacterium]
MGKIWGSDQTVHFYNLTPSDVLDAIEELGFKTTGRVIQLASMENRVYEVEVESDSDNPSDHFRIMKFYRPGRWNESQIRQEHEFIYDLIEFEITAIAPLKINGDTLFKNKDDLFYCIYNKRGGRAADEWTDDLLKQMGRLIARVHNIGATKTAPDRLRIDIETFGKNNLEYLLKSNVLPAEYKTNYEATCNQIFTIAAPLFNGIKYQRVHGDLHHGNTLINEHPFLIDFDDMLNGPCVQDIWMVTPGRDEYSINQRNILIDAYESMREFNYKELKLIETLRALRMIHFSSWIAHRKDDESFKRAFPNFGHHSYWEKEIFDLKTQLSHIQDDISSLNYY